MPSRPQSTHYPMAVARSGGYSTALPTWATACRCSTRALTCAESYKEGNARERLRRNSGGIRKWRAVGGDKRRNGGANTIVIEKAPRESAFGNSRFTGGLFRSYYNDIGDMRRLLPDLTEEEWGQLVIPHYSKDDFWRDVMALTYDYADKELTRTYIDKSLDAVAWLAQQGVPFLLGGAGAHGKVNPGAAVWVDGAGRNLVKREHEIAQAKGVEFSFETQCLDLVVEGGVVKGVRVRRGDGEEEIRADNVVLACGGFSG